MTGEALEEHYQHINPFKGIMVLREGIRVKGKEDLEFNQLQGRKIYSCFSVIEHTAIFTPRGIN
jgi:hypothetical protein